MYLLKDILLVFKRAMTIYKQENQILAKFPYIGTH